MERSLYTDLAVEWGGEAYEKNVERSEQGEGITVERFEVKGEKMRQALGRACGQYVTLHCPRPWLIDDDTLLRCERVLGDELGRMLRGVLREHWHTDTCVLVCGLGNREMTADAIGPLTVESLTATRHLREHAPQVFRSLGQRPLAAFAPGVLGQTGMETVELIGGCVDRIRPDVIVAVDALAAQSVRRLGCTVQLSDSGLSPGSGIGNHRKSVCRDSLGVPVLALGVPTVVDSDTLIRDAMAQMGIQEPPSAGREESAARSFFVAPKEIDVLVKSFAKLLAAGLERALLLI